MLHKETIFFLSPIPYQFHNKQIALFAKKLSHNFNIIFFGHPRLTGSTINFMELFKKENRNNLINFWLNINNTKNEIIVNPYIITLFKYSNSPSLHLFDRYLFKFQVALMTYMSSGIDKSIIWTSSVNFDEIWKEVNKATWIFDFFDRFPKEETNALDKEEWLLKRSRVIFVNSNLYEKISLKNKHDHINVIRTPVGYSLNPYLKVKTFKKTNNITVGYGGAISDRLDFNLIISAIKNNSNINFTFAGPIYDNSMHSDNKPFSTGIFIKKLKKFPNVKFIPSQTKTDGVRKILSNFTIGWIPYDISQPFNKYSNPTKFYEYCAIGIPTISTRIDVLKEYRKVVNFIDKGEDLGMIIKNILNTESKHKITYRKKFASDNDIAKKYKLVLGVLNKI